MTIGSDFNYPADIAQQHQRGKRSATHHWKARFPNPPDLCFDYRTLVEQKNGVAIATETNHKICIIGAGITGLTSARELHRCGFTNITLLENQRALVADTSQRLETITSTLLAGRLLKWVQ